MAGDDKAVTRTVAVIALVLLAIVALRGYLPEVEPAGGYLPEVEPASREPETGGHESVLAVAAMLAMSITVIAIALLAQTRRRTAPSQGEPHREYRGERTEVRWRLVLIAAAGLFIWPVLMVLLLRWGSHISVDAAPLTVQATRASQGGGGSETPPPEAATNGGDMFGYLAAAATVLVVLAVAATAIGRRRAGILAAAGIAGPPEPARAFGPDLVRATELALAEIGDRGRDPREAIIACYAAMERELEKSPGTSPQESDTPSEVLARAVELHALRPGSATELVDLFEEARFSPHVMDESHREDALRALQLVQRELQGVT